MGMLGRAAKKRGKMDDLWVGSDEALGQTQTPVSPLPRLKRCSSDKSEQTPGYQICSKLFRALGLSIDDRSVA